MWCVTRRDSGQNLKAAHAASDSGDFCAVESGVRRSIQWWWWCFDWRLGAKKSDEGSESFAMDSTFDGNGHTGILTVAVEQYRRWLRQRKNTRKDEELHETLREMALIPC